MNVLVTGNQGYIGSVLTKSLLDRDYGVVGYDTGFFSDCMFVEKDYDVPQISKDIRDVESGDLKNIDVIIHLAALSNDPCGELDPKLTDQINHLASVRLAKLAKTAGIQRFIFSSSCSMYGASNTSDILDETAPFNPISAYALSKVESERDVSKLADKSFTPVFLRNSTVYGVSPRMRFDLVVNNMAAYAYTTKVIKMFSDGTPWRPIIHVEDISQAFISAIEAPLDVVSNEAFNVGVDGENYQVLSIAEAIAKIIPGTSIECLGKDSKDKRSYRVSFKKIKSLKSFKPKWSLKKGVGELYDAFRKVNLNYDEFQSDRSMNIMRLKSLINEGKVDNNLRWTR